jgi:hypothetical protein
MCTLIGCLLVESGATLPWVTELPVARNEAELDRGAD